MQRQFAKSLFPQRSIDSALDCLFRLAQASCLLLVLFSFPLSIYYTIHSVYAFQTAAIDVEETKEEKKAGEAEKEEKDKEY